MKTALAKRLDREKNISVREAERWLDAEAYLKEQWWWTPGRLHQEYLCQMMFHHANFTSKSEHNCAICWGRWEPSVEWNVEREPTMMELFQPDSSQEDIADLYCNFYQLWRLPGKIHCDEEMEAHICQEIPDSVKERLWHKWFSVLLGPELRQNPANVPWLDPQAEFNARNYTTYDRFMVVRWDSCKEALVMARHTHQQPLAASALLEDKTERMSHSLSHSCRCCRSCRCLGSCQCRRSQTVDNQTKVHQVMSHHGDPAKRWAQSSSPFWSRWQVTFTHLSHKSSPKRDTSVKEPTCWPGG